MNARIGPSEDGAAPIGPSRGTGQAAVGTAVTEGGLVRCLVQWRALNDPQTRFLRHVRLCQRRGGRTSVNVLDQSHPRQLLRSHTRPNDPEPGVESAGAAV